MKNSIVILNLLVITKVCYELAIFSKHICLAYDSLCSAM